MIEFNKTYNSSLKANTELHAGGFFFCIVYIFRLEFKDDRKVILTKKIIDSFRPMDEVDVEIIKNYKVFGEYYYNDRGYLVCKFDSIYLTYTGLPLNINEKIIPFNIYDSRLLKGWSEVFQLN